jgi:hypothetical protein
MGVRGMKTIRNLIVVSQRKCFQKKCIGALLVFFSIFVFSGGVYADDLGWLQPGVRVWYVGGTGELTFSSNAQEGNLIDYFDGATLYVIQQQALVNWSSPLPPTNWANPDPFSEGVFWINPQRLKAMNTGSLVEWLGTTRLVKSKTSYSSDTIPFLRLLPLNALLELSPVREFVILTNTQNDPDKGESDGEYFFDVETGLMVSKTETLDLTRTMLSLSEINYDFVTHLAYAEDYGPHSAYAGRFAAARAGFLDNQGFQLDSMILSRYHNVFLATLKVNLMNVTYNIYYTADYYLTYDASLDTALVRSIDSDEWVVNGDHFLWWMPPTDLSQDCIRVWDLDLNRQAVASEVTTFATSDLSQTAFPCISYESEGYLTDITVNAPDMGLYVESYSDTAKTIRIEGREFYETQMKQGIPTNAPSTTTTTPGTTTTVGGLTTTTYGEELLCPVEEIYGEHSRETALLKVLRDKVLSGTTEGKEIIKLYYEMSPLLVMAVRENAELREMFRMLVDMILAVVGE